MPRESTTSGKEDGRQLRQRVSAESKPADQHVCPECNKRFASSASLESHKRVHTMKHGVETTQKRRAVAPATVGGSDAKRARVQRSAETNQDTGGMSTRTGAGYNRLLKCKLCDETFSDRSEWADHVRQRHPQQTQSAHDLSSDEAQSPRLTRRSAVSGASTLPAATLPRQPSQALASGASPERQFTLRSPGSVSRSAVSPPSGGSSGYSRSRNTTLRFEEELSDGQVQCRQCQQVFNNRRGLAAHVAQKHREELDEEQRAIEEEKMRKEEVFQRRRRDASRLIHGGIPQLITPPSRPISILTRRAPGSSLQQRSSVPSILRSSAASGTTGAASVIYPRRTTLEILTQPSPVTQATASSNQLPSVASEHVARISDSQKVISRAEDPPMGAYAEAVNQDAAESLRATDRPRSNAPNEDEGIDESAYEFSTEVTVAAVPSQRDEVKAKSPEPMPFPARSRMDKSATNVKDGQSAGSATEGLEPEVENFPCRFCKDRVFLTSYGLERHTKMSHPAQLEEVLHDIRKIQLEKAKRSEITAFGAVPQDERLFIDEGYPVLAAPPGGGYLGRRRYDFGDKENEPGDDAEVLQMAREQRAAMVAGASFTDNRFGVRARRQNDVARAKYQSCDICGILINTEHPKALESHTKAHQKNQELREELLVKYGVSWVERVTCRECNLVFKDEDKLEQHRRNVHVRRRHFLCRFCGDVFRNMRDLNIHKERRHEAYEGHRRLGDTSPPVSRRHAVSTRRGYEGASEVGIEEFACRSTCEVCGLQMVRPSNLIRHMKLAHNRTNFTATVETRGMPPFKIDVHEGRFLWGCCDEVFDDRQAFINHRRMVHSPNYTSNPKECEHCGLAFKNNVSYINHLRTHRPRVCNICGESYGNSVVDLNAFRAHMIRHRDQGYTVRLPPIEEELAATEQQELWRAINEEEADDGSEDEYSIYSGSGVESDLEDDSASDDDDAPVDQMTCPMCEKVFSCVYRYCDHWKLHCLQPFRNGLTLKTKPFSYKKRRAGRPFKCRFCPKRFNHGATLVIHSLRCGRRRLGIVPSDESEPNVVSGGSSKTSSPSKSSNLSKASIGVTGELRKEPSKSSTLQGGEGDDGKPKSADERETYEEAMKDLEDQLDVSPKTKKFVPDYIEKAYVVEWDTNKPPTENPYVCQNCRQSFGDFLSLIMHVKTHIAYPITESDDDDAGEEGKEAGEKEKEKEKTGQDEDSPGKLESSKKKEKVTVSVLRIRTSTSEALGKYACQVCGRCFQDSKALSAHLDEAHRPHKHHRCNLCRRRFWKAAGLRRHQRRRHNISGYHHYCGTCGKRFLNMESLNAHEAKHELTNSLYQCEDCTISFYGLQQLKQHFKENHDGVTILSCPVCCRIHTDRKSLDEHLDNDHATVRTFCRVCKKMFHTPTEARQHRRRVHMADGKVTQSCSLCGKKYFDKRQLSLHTWRHLSTKSHQCKICDHPFDNDEAVRTHLEVAHNLGWLDSRDMIVQNSTVFGTADSELGITEDRFFSCHVCGKKFSGKVAVKEHLERGVHQRKKKRACTICGVKFIKQWSLAQHMRRRHHQGMSGDQAATMGQEKGGQTRDREQALPAKVAQLLLNQGEIGDVQYVTSEGVQMIVADEATAAAVMAATGGGGSGQEYQVLLVQNENGETLQLALGPQAQIELAQLQQQQGSSNAGNQATGEGQPMEIDETNYQQFLNN